MMENHGLLFLSSLQRDCRHLREGTEGKAVPGPFQQPSPRGTTPQSTSERVPVESCLAAMLQARHGSPKVRLGGLDPTQSPTVSQRGNLAAGDMGRWQPHRWDLKTLLGRARLIWLLR